MDHIPNENGHRLDVQVPYYARGLSYDNQTALVYLTGRDRMDRKGIDHAQCTEHHTCVAFNTEIGVKIETAHEEDGCGCQHVLAPREERVQILERGGIPVLRCLRKRNGSFEVNFVPASLELKYAAISHLWADGLGNVFENSLPHCQLSRLVKALPFKPTEAIILLDRSDPLLRVDETAVCHGACLLAIGYKEVGHDSERAQAAIYVGPLTWGRIIGNTDHEALPRLLASHVSTSDVPSIIISSDIASWPQLPPSRARRLRSPSARAISTPKANISICKDLTQNPSSIPVTVGKQVDGGTVCVVNQMMTCSKFSVKVLPAGAVLIAGMLEEPQPYRNPEQDLERYRRSLQRGPIYILYGG
ncbi:uncharacterized protein MYCFIDRAFT_193814 [Pseudocercospora fijiensis CIRAD86]|uniref:Uncharacterized protein n=1 Tax=Pseudocercospora fijiensis (strain CIRAD86) TaxID=383855 RepID=M3B881_PSEFD|nr:uncharacterized protein MYCFIDRAFT_193814 [Pseudocercospora fijiensis CIRAD86]EME85523.1 hypothetical protein MYCFIDRAFT_193814 [Pseudocercospora fijiensis CIRAD86]